jgi:hypothetical protein
MFPRWLAPRTERTSLNAHDHKDDRVFAKRTGLRKPAGTIAFILSRLDGLLPGFVDMALPALPILLRLDVPAPSARPSAAI